MLYFLKMEPTYKAINYIITSLFVVAISACSLTDEPSSEMLDKARGEKYDIIIVPGVPFDSADGKWSKIMKSRVYWSKYLYENGITKNVMYSGSAVYTAYYEAEIMALYGQALGIAEENIFAENKAEHSTENVYYSYKKAKKLGFEKIALATDPFQSKMLETFIEETMNSDVGIIPIVFDSLWSTNKEMVDPEIEFTLAFKEGFVSIVDREGFWKRFEGTLGKNIDTTAYE